MLTELIAVLTAGNVSKVKELVTSALSQNIPPKDILENGLIKGMDAIGERFKKCEVFIPEVMIAAKAMHAGLEILQPQLARSGVRPAGKVVVGTVKGDLHDIGKNIVAMMFKGAGFVVTDLGIDVAPQKFINAAKNEKPDIIAMSSLLTTSMNSMRDVIELLKNEGMKDGVKTMIGGAPVTQAFADKIGADGYAEDAASAVDKARELLRVHEPAR